MKFETKIFMALLAGVIAALGVYKLGVAAPPGGVQPKFKVNDQITYKVSAPTNILYQIMAVNLDTWTYDMKQIFEGQLVNPSTVSIAVVDANYIKIGS